jgi:hypothetical protein
MTLFGANLAEVEARLMENQKKTKEDFPEETLTIEFGLALLRDLTLISKDTLKDYQTKPNLFTNLNLFARNRQLLLNGYFCTLSSSYGTQFVILRTVFENNNLMRYFNKKPQCAFKWLSKEIQERFPEETKLKFGTSGKYDVKFHPTTVREKVFEGTGNEKVRSELETFYHQLCDYTHPNFMGWRELVIPQKNGVEIILNMPRYEEKTAKLAVGLLLFSINLTFKAYVLTFKNYLVVFLDQLKEWNDNYTRLIAKYQGN